MSLGIGGVATLEEYDAENNCALYSFELYKHGGEEYNIKGLMLITFKIEHKHFISNKGKRKDWAECTILNIESTDIDPERLTELTYYISMSIEVYSGKRIPPKISYYK